MVQHNNDSKPGSHRAMDGLASPDPNSGVGHDPAKRGAIGLFSAINIVIASMIGAGVYTTSGFALADLGSPILVLLAWAISGFLALCGAVSYGGLAQRFSESGGEYLFLARSIHPAAGYIAGFVSLLAGFTGAIAFAALTFEAYLMGMVTTGGDTSPLPAGVIASSTIIIAWLMHGFRVRAGTRFQDLLVVLKLAMLLAFLAFAGMSLGRPWEGMATAGQRPEGWLVLPALAVSLTWISLSYCGFNAAIYITEETYHGGKTVRDALIIGTLIVTTLYLLLNAVFVLAPPASEVVGKEDVAAVAARYVGGAKLETLLRYVILLSLATSVLSMMMTGPRVYAKMAEDGVLPGWFKFDAELPGRGVFAQGVLAVAVVSIATLRQLLSYLGLTLSLCAALTVAAIFVLKRRGEPVEVIGYPWTPLAFVIGTLAIVLTAGTQRPIELAVAAATLAVGWFAYQFSHPHRTDFGNESPRPRDQDA